jgi:hypothetical protein
MEGVLYQHSTGISSNQLGRHHRQIAKHKPMPLKEALYKRIVTDKNGSNYHYRMQLSVTIVYCFIEAYMLLKLTKLMFAFIKCHQLQGYSSLNPTHGFAGHKSWSFTLRFPE